MDDWQQGAPDGAPDEAPQVRVVHWGGLDVGAHPAGWCEYWQARRESAPVIIEEQRGSCQGLALFLFAVANACGLGLWLMRALGG